MAVSPYISLFSGVGGLDLALKVAAPEAQCVCHVEGDLQAANILAARMQDGSLDEAPIWSDVRTFDGKPFSGKVDGIIGGFPCQDLSIAGKRAGIHGAKSGLWFEYVRIIREVQPRWCFIENVPAVLAFPAGGVVLGELAKLWFDAEWGTLRAAEVGASHGRKRAFLLAYRQSQRHEWGWSSRRRRIGSAHRGGAVDDAASTRRCTGESESHRALRNEARWQESDGRRDGVADTQRAERRPHDELCGYSGERCDSQGQASSGTRERSEYMADAGLQHEHVQQRTQRVYEPAGSDCQLADTSSHRLQHRRSDRRNLWQELQTAQRGSLPLFAPGPSDERWPSYIDRFPQLAPALSSFDRRLLAARCVGLLPFGVPCTHEELGRIVAQAISAKEVERDVWRVAHELAFGLDEFSRVDQLRGIGNGVVAIQGAAMFTVLSRRAGLRF